MATDISRVISTFVSETAGRGSPARLRAILLDEAATSGRVGRREIEAVVRAYELGVASTPVDQWSGIHATLAAATDATSASVALDEWATALHVTWRTTQQPPVPPPPWRPPVATTTTTTTTTGTKTATRSNRTTALVIGGVLALVMVVGVALASRDDGGEDAGPGTTAPQSDGDDSTTSDIATTTTTDTTTSSEVTTTVAPRSRSQVLLDLSWIPAGTCAELGGLSSSGAAEYTVDPTAAAEIVCDRFDTAGVVVTLHLFTPADQLQSAYQRWIDAYGITAGAGGPCPQSNTQTPDAPRPYDSESTFSSGSVPDVGRILCTFDPSGTDTINAYVVWYQYDLPYLAVISAPDLDTAFAWWVDHPLGGSWA